MDTMPDQFAGGNKMHDLLPLALLQASYGYWPWVGGFNLICAIVGYLIAGGLGLVLGLLLGPIGLLIAVLLRRPATV
jgi:hypothetical protein